MALPSSINLSSVITKQSSAPVIDPAYPTSSRPVGGGSGALTPAARQFTIIRNFNGTNGVQTSLESDGYDGADSRTTYSTAQAYSGSTSGHWELLASEDAADGGFGKWGGEFVFPNELQEGDELFCRWRMYYPTGFNPFTSGGGGRIKHWRVHTKAPDGSNEGYNDFYFDSDGTGYMYDFTKEGSNRRDAFCPRPQYDLPYNQWVTYNHHLIFHSDPAQALSRFWVDNDFVFDSQTDVTDGNGDPIIYTLDTPSSLVDFIYHLTYWNGVVIDNEGHVDDVYITSERPANTDSGGRPWIGV